MGVRGSKRRQKQDRRRKRKQKRAKAEAKSGGDDPGHTEPSLALLAGEAELLELFHPDRLDRRVACFCDLAIKHLPDEFGFPREAFLNLVLEPRENDGSLPSPVLPEFVIPALASPEQARISREILWDWREDLLDRYQDDDPEACDALVAAGVAADGCLDVAGSSSDVFWTFVFAFNFEVSLRGELVAHLVSQRVRQEPSAVEALYRAAVSDPEIAEDLAGLEEWLDPAALARAYCHCAEFEGAGMVDLGFESALHLVRLERYVQHALADRLLSEGPTPALLEELWTLVDEAFQRDVTPEVQEEALHRAAAGLNDLEWLEDDEVLDHVACYLALRAFPPQENALLRLGHATAPWVALGDVESEEEELRLYAVDEDPEDTFALEQLMLYFHETGERVRRRRVQSYLEAVRTERGRFRSPSQAPS